MDDSFDIQQFGKSLSNILSILSKSNYTSIEPIATELKTDSIDSALYLLETRLSYFKSYNFHPISASITKVLAFAYRIKNHNEKFILYGFQCISQLYQRFLPTDIQEIFIKSLPECPDVNVDVFEISSLPFDISAGFINQFSSPSEDVSFYISIRSHLEYEIPFESISIKIDHTQEQPSIHQISDQIELKSNQKVVLRPSLPIHTPGVVKIDHISIKIYNVVLNIKAFKGMGYTRSSIRPYDTECKFELVHPDFGITNVDYPLQIKCDNIPEGAESFTIDATLISDSKDISFADVDSSSDSPNHFKHIFEKPPKSIEQKLKIRSSTKCNVKVKVLWSLLHQTVNTIHEEEFDFIFTDSFVTSFKLFNSDRSPINLKSSPVLSTDQQYIFVPTFEYNLPAQSTILELQPVPANDAIKLNQVGFDVPLDILTSEVFTSVCFLTFSENAKSGSLGRYTMKYKVLGVDELKDSPILTFDVQLPSINIKEKLIEVTYEIKPDEIHENSESQLILNIKGLETSDVTLDISTTDDYKIIGDFQKNISLQPNQTESITIVFEPLKSGKIELHPYLTGKGEILLWEQSIPVDVKKVDA